MDIEEQEQLAYKWVDDGYYLKTKKGANFRGYAEAAYYNKYMDHWGVVIIASDHAVEGTVHVYPVTQLEPV